MWGWISIERAGQDVRYAVRMMRRKPGFALAAILTLMLGIGGNTAMFSLMNALLMRTLPVDRPDELVRLIEEGRDPSAPQEVFTLVTQDTLQGQTRALSGVLASSMVGVRPNEIEVGSEKRPVFLQFVSDNYFDVLGIRAFRGRAFTQPDPGSPREPIAVISHEYWQRQFAADPSAIGARFQLRSGHEFTIAGIAPPGFGGTELDVPAEIWVSVEHTVPPGDADRVRGRWMRIMGRLQPGATMDDDDPRRVVAPVRVEFPRSRHHHRCAYGTHPRDDCRRICPCETGRKHRSDLRAARGVKNWKIPRLPIRNARRGREVHPIRNRTLLY